MFTRSILLWLYALSLMLAAPAWADKGFVPLPTAAGVPKDLEIQVRRYEGSTNGQLTVEIRNPTTRTVKFEAGGLYFVPEQNANDAPQRLGAPVLLPCASSPAALNTATATPYRRAAR